MDGFLKIAGGAIFFISLIAVVLLAMSTNGLGAAAIVYALPFMVGGAAVYALGAMLNNLIAIRTHAEQQTRMLEAISGNVAKMANRQED